MPLEGSSAPTVFSHGNPAFQIATKLNAAHRHLPPSGQVQQRVSSVKGKRVTGKAKGIRLPPSSDLTSVPLRQLGSAAIACNQTTGERRNP